VISEFNVAFTSLTATSPSGTDKLGSASFPMMVLLDAGSTISTLPPDLVTEMYKEAGVAMSADGIPTIPCNFANSKGSFGFGFGGPNGVVINVGMSELVRPLRSSLKYTNGTYAGLDICLFGVQAASSSSSPLILGDSFLRSAYVVYDLENVEVAMANTNFNAATSNIVAFPSKAAQIPNSTPAPSQAVADMSAAAVTGTPASFAAASGFTSTSAAGTAASLDWNLFAVMTVSVTMMLIGSGSFLAL
jgi:elongation factor G